MHSRYKFTKVSPSASYNPACRLYIEAWGVVRYTEAPELRRRYAGATEDTPALCEQALVCTLYSPLSNRIGYVYENVDTFTAIAVLVSRYEKRAINEDIIHELGEVVRIGPHVISQLRYGAEVLALMQVASEPEATFEGRISLIQSIIDQSLQADVLTHIVKVRRVALENALAHTVLQPIVRGYVMLAIGDAHHTLDVAFEYASIVVWVQPNAPVSQPASSHTQKTYRRITVARWDPLIPFNAAPFRSAMSLLDMGSVGWQLTRAEVVSPPNHNTIVTVRQAVTQVLMHRPRNEQEDDAAMAPFVGMSNTDWERLEAASHMKTDRARE